MGEDVPTRQREQRTGDAGETFVRDMVDTHASWLCRTQDRDFGVDLEAEFAPGNNDHQRLTGKLLKLQVKSSRSWRVSFGRIAVPLSREYLEYIAQFRLPVILIAADLIEKTASWLWLQSWLLDNENRLAAVQSDTITVHVPSQQTLESGLDGDWSEIAMGRDPVSMVLALRETVSAASASHNTSLLEGALALLDLVDPAARTWTVEKIIDALAGLRPSAAPWEAAKFEPRLWAVIDRFGYTMTSDQIVRLVVRDDRYSRTGLSGLARLYDRWPEHAHGLDLRDRFTEVNADVVAWYCEMRHRYPNMSGLELACAATKGTLPSTRFRNLDLDTDDLLHTWFNRGDSALLDHLISAEESARSV
ncbi:DUF4365 domain-containing protein [Nocardia sp. NPDC052566]|uniref:DUF4365 domain-containing protein n=1 Tax=Nocardia sp. NPDC052566 TaxID=3364330 RepID=UPI0037C75800